MNMDSRMLTTSAIAGVAIGLLSAIPGCNLVNCLLCGWAWGGVMASTWYYNRSGAGITATQGALMGVIAGLLGGLIYTLVSLVLSPVTGAMTQGFIKQMADATTDPATREQLRQLASTAMAGEFSIVSLCTSMFLFGIFGAIGGAIGAALFGKKNVPAAPAM
jgi:hypothetical protein